MRGLQTSLQRLEALRAVRHRFAGVALRPYPPLPRSPPQPTHIKPSTVLTSLSPAGHFDLPSFAFHPLGLSAGPATAELFSNSPSPKGPPENQDARHIGTYGTTLDGGLPLVSARSSLRDQPRSANNGVTQA